MANHLSTNLTFATSEQDHLDIHLAQAARFQALEVLTPEVLAALVDLVQGGGAVATQQFVLDELQNHADADADVHGAVASEDHRLAVKVGGGKFIFGDHASTEVPVGVYDNDVRIGPAA